MPIQPSHQKKKRRYVRKIILFSIPVIFIVSLIALLFFISPEQIVEELGVNNVYILTFLVSFFGGFSAGGSISFISLLITLSAGGMNPIYLGLIAGTSLAMGDMIMFYAGSRGRDLIKGKWNERINKIARIFKKRTWLKKATPLIAYLYLGFTPMPNDFLILTLAAVKYPTKKMSIIIILGDITFALMISILFANGIGIFG